MMPDTKMMKSERLPVSYRKELDTMKEKSQIELFEADASWFHMFKEMIRSKTWANMSPLAKALYPVIKSFTNWKTGHSFPSIETMEEYSGLSRPSIFKALRELETLGYIRSKKAPGKPSIYTLIEKFEIQDEVGQPVASASFDYLPSIIGDAMIELKNYVARGMTDDGKLQIINVERFVIENLTIINGDHNIGTQNNTLDVAQLVQGMKDKMEGKETDAAKYADTVEKRVEPDKRNMG
jgi:DNA-binding transcriptional regulator GbsR (MarR family)